MTEHKEKFVRRMNVMVENADELFDLLEKAHKQAYELDKTLVDLETFIPNIKLEREH